MTSSPPGASTRAISSSAFSPSSKRSIAQIDITRSKLARSARAGYPARPDAAGQLVARADIGLVADHRVVQFGAGGDDSAAAEDGVAHHGALADGGPVE